MPPTSQPFTNSGLLGMASMLTICAGVQENPFPVRVIGGSAELGLMGHGARVFHEFS
jgi:hypothetical protein